MFGQIHIAREGERARRKLEFPILPHQLRNWMRWIETDSWKFVKSAYTNWTVSAFEHRDRGYENTCIITELVASVCEAISVSHLAIQCKRFHFLRQSQFIFMIFDEIVIKQFNFNAGVTSTSTDARYTLKRTNIRAQGLCGKLIIAY